jgi:FemAB-related protein (PEP-CTERM system-associated)
LINANSYHVKLISVAEEHAWERYVSDHREGTLFHSLAWKQVVERAFQHKSHYFVAIQKDTGEIVGLLPLFEIKSMLFDHFLVSVPFGTIGGALADSPDIAKSLTKRSIELTHQVGASYLELKNSQPLPDLATKSLYFNFSRPIFQNSEDNLLAIPRKSRAMVRKGIKAGLTREFGEHLLEEFYQILATNYHRHGTPIFPKRFFKIFLEEFRTQVLLMVVREPSGKGVAAVMSFFYADTIMPYFAGSLTEYRAWAPNDYMYWMLMEYGREHGYRVFDFGRSKADTGSYSFKKNWGFEPKPLAYQYHLAKGGVLPNLSPTNIKYRKKIELWRKMPYGLTKILGPPLAKYLV